MSCSWARRISRKAAASAGSAANVTWKLKVTEDGFMIRDKVIRLLNSDGVLTSISYLF